MTKRLVWVRWLLVLPAALAAGAASVAIGIALYSAAEKLCPADQMVSGMCEAPWFRYADRAIICAAAGMAAASIVVSCTLIAPSHRKLVMWVTLLAGGVVASWLATLTGAFPELITAIAVALLAAWWLRGRKWLDPAPDATFETGS